MGQARYPKGWVLKAASLSKLGSTVNNDSISNKKYAEFSIK